MVKFPIIEESMFSDACPIMVNFLMGISYNKYLEHNQVVANKILDLLPLVDNTNNQGLVVKRCYLLTNWAIKTALLKHLLIKDRWLANRIVNLDEIIDYPTLILAKNTLDYRCDLPRCWQRIKYYPTSGALLGSMLVIEKTENGSAKNLYYGKLVSSLAAAHTSIVCNTINSAFDLITQLINLE